MVENIIEWMQGIPKELIVLLISMLPILELRGGLIAASLLGIDWVIAFPLCVLGNVIPIPFILIFFNKIIEALKKTKHLGKIAQKLENKAISGSKELENYKSLGLMLFVGVPLPGTGGWTGAMVAAALRMKIRKSSVLIFLGILMAGIIMSVLAYFIPNLFGFNF